MIVVPRSSARSKLGVERRWRQIRLMRVAIVEKREEGPPILLVEPAQESLIDRRRWQPVEIVVIINEFAELDAVGNPPAERGAEEYLPGVVGVVLIVAEAAMQAKRAAAIVPVRHESSGGVAVLHKGFRQGGIGPVERRFVAYPQIVGQAAGE